MTIYNDNIVYNLRTSSLFLKSVNPYSFYQHCLFDYIFLHNFFCFVFAIPIQNTFVIPACKMFLFSLFRIYNSLEAFLHNNNKHENIFKFSLELKAKHYTKWYKICG